MIKFEPAYDYSQTDLSKEENQILYKFGELIKTLITIASEAEKQKNIIGMGVIADEIALDFEVYFALSYNQYLNNQLLNEETLDELFLLDCLFDKYSGNRNPNFWDDSSLETNSDWKEVRKMTKNILMSMGMDNLDIEYIHYDIIDKNKIVGLQTKTRLVNKKA